MRRLTVVESINFQSDGLTPLTVLTQSEVLLESDSEPFQKVQKVTEEWHTFKLDMIREFMENCEFGTICIKHDLPVKPQTNPTAVEKKLDAERFITLRLNQVDFRLFPGESFRAFPESISSLSLKCSQGQAKALVTIFPR